MTKTNTSKNKKSATAVRRKPTQLDRIEAKLDRLPVDIVLVISRADKARHEEVCKQLAAIQADLSLLKSGASFMQELYRATQQEEQGLEDGDYTDASKEVADALTAMGWSDFPGMKSEWRWFEWYKPYDAISPVLIRTGIAGTTPKTNAEFLSRARVTAKKLGKAKEEEQKLARLTFGTRVNTHVGTRIFLSMVDGSHKVAQCASEGGTVSRFYITELTIID